MLFVIAFATIWMIQVSFSIRPYRLRVEYMNNPYGIDVLNPRFFWAVDTENIRGDDQTAYQLKIYNISSTGEQTLVIDTGKIISNVSSQVVVKGFNVVSHSDYIWSIIVYNQSDIASTDNQLGYFSGGLLNGISDWMDAIWIGIPKYKRKGNAYQIRNSNITLNKPFNRIKCYIVMPGYYKAWINNQLIDDHSLGYFTTFEKRIYYDSWDCTKQFNIGSNTFGIWLGNGWYSQPTVNVGPPMFKLLIRIEYNDNTIESIKSNNNDYYQHTGPIRMNDIYIGEWYDATMETPGWLNNNYDYISNGWIKADVINNKTCSNYTVGELVSSAIMPKARKTETFSSIAMTEPSTGIFVFDMGQNIAGLSRIKIPGNTMKGKNITLIHSEELNKNGFAVQMYGNSPMIGTYTMRGDGEEEIYEASFTFYGFQYIQVEGYPELSQNCIESYFVHTDLDTSGGSIIFGPSNINNNDNEFNAYLLNKIQRMTVYSSLSNYLNIPTDCPQRERRGWLGDGQLTALMTIHNFDMAASYTKWLKDIRDTQEIVYNINKGALPDCSPWYHHGRYNPGDPSWTNAYTNLVYWMWKYYGDTRVIEEHYNNIKLELQFLETELDIKTGLLPNNVNPHGDWCAVIPNTSGQDDCKHTSALISTYDWGKECLFFSELADVIGNTNDSQIYRNKYESAKQAIYKYYWNVSQGAFVGLKNETAIITTLNALGLDMGVLSSTNDIKSAAKTIADFQIKHDYHLNAGIIGVKFIYPELCKNGYCDLAMNISLQTSMPSYGFWYQNKATTLWEHWQASQYSNAGGSKNHIMFGAQGAWYYQYLAGIQQKQNSTNWNNIMIDPYTNTTFYNITTISAMINTYKGELSSTWSTDINKENKNKYLQINVTIPSGCIGNVVLRRNLIMINNGNPSINKWIVKEGDTNIWQNMEFSNNDKGVVSGKVDNDALLFTTESGSYSFVLSS